MNVPRNSLLRHQSSHQEGVQEGRRQQFSSIHASVLAEHSIGIGSLEDSLVGRKDCFLPEELDFGNIVPVLQLVVLLLEKPVESLALLVLQMAHKLFGHFVLQKVLEQSALLVLQKVLGQFDQFGLQEVVEQFVLLAHTDGDVPNMYVTLPEQDAFTLGYAIYFFELAIALSGYLNAINPFDQPGVEAYKKNMFALLGKPGFEELGAELNARL